MGSIPSQYGQASQYGQENMRMIDECNLSRPRGNGQRELTAVSAAAAAAPPSSTRYSYRSAACARLVGAGTRAS